MLKLVVDNAPQPPEPELSDAELRALSQGSLVRAAKTLPLRVLVVADYGEGETSLYWTDTRGGAEALLDAGRDLLTHTEE